MLNRLSSTPRLVHVRVAVAVAGLAVILAACRSSSGLPAAGTGSPTAAASGFAQDLASGNVSGACGYVLASQQAACNTSLGHAAIKISGLGIGNDIVVGNEALVAVEGSSCVGPTTASTICTSNSSPNGGLPTAANFANTYAATFNTSAYKALHLYEQNNQWYVVAQPPSGTSGSTGTPTTAATTGTSGSTSTSTPGTSGT